MLMLKKVDFGDFVGSMEFFIVDEMVKCIVLEYVICCDFYMVDDSELGGMKFVKCGRVFKVNLFLVLCCYLLML